MVAIEKETKLKEYMLMMGLSRNALWASWFLHYFLLLIIPCLLTTVVLTGELRLVFIIFQDSDWSRLLISREPRPVSKTSDLHDDEH